MVGHLFNAKPIVFIKSTVTAKPCILVMPHMISHYYYYNSVVSFAQCCSYLTY